MSLIPAFHLGVWNAWLMMLFYPLHPLLMIVIDKSVGTGGIFKKMGTDVPYTKEEKRDSLIVTAGMYILTAYSIFLPLKLGTIWFIAGFPIYLAGVILFLTALVAAATTPIGQPFIRGIYRFSRNPMYLSWILILIGVGIASASWLFLLVTAVIMTLLNSQLTAEERICLNIYGDEFQKYRDRTPRWIGIQKSK